MPSLSFTPGRLTLVGGEFNPEPVRFGFTPGALVLTGGTFSIGPSLSSGVTAALAGILDNLFANESIVDEKGRPTRRFQQIWANAIDGIKDAFTATGLSIAELQHIYDGINTAQATATEAVQQSLATAREKALTDSYIAPLGVLTAASSGTITIDAHTRYYGDGTSAAVDAGSVTSFAPGDYVTVYYTDPARAGGAVSYIGTTVAVGQTGDTHVVGQVTIPQPGDADTGGTGTAPPSWKYPDGYDPNAGYGFL